MDGYTILAGALIFFGLFIYLTWFSVSIRVVSKEEKKQLETPIKLKQILDLKASSISDISEIVDLIF